MIECLIISSSIFLIGPDTIIKLPDNEPIQITIQSNSIAIGELSIKSVKPHTVFDALKNCKEVGNAN